MTYARFRAVLCAVVIGVFTAGSRIAPAQTTQPGRETSAASVASYPLAQSMPVDPEVTVGTLPNGLKYYIRANPRPARRAELRLVVKAGSVLEDDDQRGLAHFVEHMEFEGTTHFPGQSISDFLASLGLSIGPDANAETSYDDTQYTLRIPTDVPGVLDRALLVLEDWANAATFDQRGIDRQRGIVLSEWRSRLGAAERTDSKIRNALLQGSRYAERSPIGLPDSIQGATREQLMRFYRDWYRPDLMAVIVVGDVDRPAVTEMIKTHFSALKNPSPARPRTTFDVTEQPGTRFAIVTDKEVTDTVVQLTDLRPARNQGSVGGYRDLMLDALFADMFGDRLNERSQSADAPFLRAQAGRGLFPAPRTRDQAIVQALVTSDGVQKGLDALLTELLRVQRFGFNASELDRAKLSMMNSYERAVTESPDRESASRADEYTRNFLEDEALPTIWQELAFHRRFIPDVTLREVNALANDWFPDRNRLVVVSGPESASVVLPTAAQLDAVVKAASAKRLEPYVDIASAATLLDAPPKPGTIVKTTVNTDAGITEWTLSNGATVVLKPTTLRADQILFRATAPGGTSLASDADFISARVADDAVRVGGVGRFSALALDRVLNGKVVAVTPFINEVEQGMGGGSTPQDLETMFQLLYLRFTAPRSDPNAFAAMTAQARAALANQQANPDVVFNQTIDAALSQNHPREQSETAATVAQWNLDKAIAFYKARFADAGNFTFVFVGSFTVDAIKPLVETYVASLPATNAHETWRDVGATAPSGVIERTVQKGIEPKSEVAILFHGPLEYTDDKIVALRTMTLVLQSRLLDAIREQLGGTYSITVDLATEKFPKPEYRIRIEWNCDPTRTAALIERVFDEVQFVKTNRLANGPMNLIRQGLLREYERNSADNGYLLNQISRRYRDNDGANVAAVTKMPDRIAALTSEALQDAARKYLDTMNYVQVVLTPETR